MVKEMRKPKQLGSEEDQLFQNWLSMLPARAETRKMDYWFDRLKVEMYGDVNNPNNFKSRWSQLLTRMETDFPQYGKLKEGTAHQTTVLYKSIWRHFQRLLAKWQKDSPQKFRKPRSTLS